MESGKAPGVTVVLSESARTRVYVTVMPDETYELPGVISAKSPLMVCLLTEPLVVTRRLTDAPATLPMLAMTHPPLLLGEPLAAAPAKEKVVTSPQNTGGGEGDGSDGGGGGGGGARGGGGGGSEGGGGGGSEGGGGGARGGSGGGVDGGREGGGERGGGERGGDGGASGGDGGGGCDGGHAAAGTEASIVKEKSEVPCPGVYTIWLVPVPVKVSVMERLRSSGVRDAADDGSLPSVPSPLKVSPPLRSTLVSEVSDTL